jgi:hypothetical protein
VSGLGEGVMGNREVPRIEILGPGADLRGARAETNPEKEGAWGKHGFPRATEAKAKEEAA